MLSAPFGVLLMSFARRSVVFGSIKDLGGKNERVDVAIWVNIPVLVVLLLRLSR